MSVVDLPPGMGLVGTALGTFRAPRGARVLAIASVVLVAILGAVTWGLVSRHPYRWHASTQVVLPVAFGAIALLGLAVRHARVAITRDGVRWGWDALGFHQPAARIVRAHVYADGVALEAVRGSWWFLAARDWERFDALVRQVRRAELAVEDHAGTAPLRARLQSYGRFLDAMLVLAIVAALGVMIWAA